MAQINKKNGPTNGQKIGQNLQQGAPALAAIPYVGPALSIGASIVGGAMANKSPTAGIGAGASRLGDLAAKAPDQSGAMQRAVAPAAPQLAQPVLDDYIQKLRDAQDAAQQLPAQVRNQAQPVLAAAQEEAMRRRMGGYV
jgi:hypothetical protein